MQTSGGPAAGVIRMYSYDAADNITRKAPVTLSALQTVSNGTSAGAEIGIKIAGQATGMVTFTENGQFFGSAYVTNGQASVLLEGFARGVHTVTASYAESGVTLFSFTFTVRVQDLGWLPAVLELLLSDPPPPPAAASSQSLRPRRSPDNDCDRKDEIDGQHTLHISPRRLPGADVLRQRRHIRAAAKGAASQRTGCDNGVDLMSGNLSMPRTEIDIGPPETNLAYVRYDASGSYIEHTSTDIWMRFYTFTQPGQADVAVTVGNAVDAFDWNGTQYVPLNGMGGALVFDSGSQNYIYTQRDGTIIRFPAQSADDKRWGLRALSVLRPDGYLIELTNKTWSGAFGATTRVQSVQTNAGFQLKLDYSHPILTRSPTQVTVLNRGYDPYCNPSADSCTATTGAPAITLAAVDGPYDPLEQRRYFSITDAGARLTRWTSGGKAAGGDTDGGLSSIKTAASANDDVFIGYKTFGVDGDNEYVVRVGAVIRRRGDDVLRYARR